MLQLQVQVHAVHLLFFFTVFCPRLIKFHEPLLSKQNRRDKQPKGKASFSVDNLHCRLRGLHMKSGCDKAAFLSKAFAKETRTARNVPRLDIHCKSSGRPSANERFTLFEIAWNRHSLLAKYGDSVSMVKMAFASFHGKRTAQAIRCSCRHRMVCHEASSFQGFSFSLRVGYRWFFFAAAFVLSQLQGRVLRTVSTCAMDRNLAAKINALQEYVPSWKAEEKERTCSALESSFTLIGVQKKNGTHTLPAEQEETVDEHSIDRSVENTSAKSRKKNRPRRVDLWTFFKPSQNVNPQSSTGAAPSLKTASLKIAPLVKAALTTVADRLQVEMPKTTE